MDKIIKTTIMIVLCFILLFCGCGCSDAGIYEVADDEIALHIKLNIKEDIGLLIVDYEFNGSGGSGGTSNANKTLLKHDELIIYTLNKQYFESPPDADILSIRFSIITEYFKPNYENIYPDEYTKTIDEISFEAEFGKSYLIEITGDKINGYTAVPGTNDIY